MVTTFNDSPQHLTHISTNPPLLPTRLDTGRTGVRIFWFGHLSREGMLQDEFPGRTWHDIAYLCTAESAVKHQPTDRPTNQSNSHRRTTSTTRVPEWRHQRKLMRLPIRVCRTAHLEFVSNLALYDKVSKFSGVLFVDARPRTQPSRPRLQAPVQTQRQPTYYSELSVSTFRLFNTKYVGFRQSKTESCCDCQVLIT